MSKPDRRQKPAPLGAEPQSASSEFRPEGSVVDRRSGIDRRLAPGGVQPTGLERRRGRGRRLSDFTKSAEEGELTHEQFLFVMAIEAFKKANAKSFPTWTDVLEVIRLMGYRKTMPSELSLENVEDWREPPNTPANVRTQRQIERDRAARGSDAA